MSATSFRTGPGAEVFGSLVDPTVNMAVWSRPPDLALQLWLESLLPTLSTTTTTSFGHHETPDGIALLPPLPEHPLRHRLADDVSHLTRALVNTLPPGWPAGKRVQVKTSFGPVRDDQCRKFHVDWVVARLLTTWVGPGTEWLDDADVDRRHVGASACCPTDANKAIVRRPEGIRRAHAGEVILMKGEGWPGNGGRGLVHRSPPLEALAKPGMPAPGRLVFVATIMADPKTRPTQRPAAVKDADANEDSR